MKEIVTDYFGNVLNIGDRVLLRKTFFSDSRQGVIVSFETRVNDMPRVNVTYDDGLPTLQSGIIVSCKSVTKIAAANVNISAHKRISKIDRETT